jgi:hypothetical protein
MRIGLYDQWVIDLGGNFALSRLFEPPEAVLEELDLFLVRDLESVDVARFPLASLIELRHRSGNGRAQDFEAFTDIQSRIASLKHSSKLVENSHAFTFQTYSKLHNLGSGIPRLWATRTRGFYIE